MKKTIITILIVFITFSAFSYSKEKLEHAETYSSGDEKYDDIKYVVKKLHIQMDKHFEKKVEQLQSDDLLKGHGFFTTDRVIEYANSGAKKMSLEYTLRLYNESFESFVSKISPHDWGLYLHKLIGRGISDIVTNEEGFVTQQVERMVLKSFPFNLDMTKTEVIEYKNDKITVYWRVFESKNKSTLSDIGSVSFIRKGDSQTLVKFRSAHLLGSNPFIEVAVPNLPTIQKQIKDTFLDHLESYKKRIESANNK